MVLIGTTSFWSHNRALRLPKPLGSGTTICGTIESNWINLRVWMDERHIATHGNWRTFVEASCP